MITWHLETRKISTLKPHPSNPRKLTKEQHAHIKTSLDKFGLVEKPIVNPDGAIIGGHQRIKVLKDSGLKEVECWVPDSPLDQRALDEMNIRLNKNTGEWDFDILANSWEITDLFEWGFTADELQFDDVDKIDTEEDSEILEPGKDEDAITKLGDVYELGPHRLVCGDSTMPDIVEKCLNGSEPILMVTDPPYGVEYDPNFNKDAGQKKLGKVLNDDKANWALSYHLFPGSVAYVWSSDKFAFETVTGLIQAGYVVINQIIWAKPSLVLGRGDYHSQHEPCWYAVKKGHTHNWYGDRKQTSLWDVEKVNISSKNQDERTDHGTQKPLECMAKPIRNNTAEGEGVYDPFLGSGTTLIAAEQNDRICYGIELSPAYCDIIVKRWVKFRLKQGKDAIVKLNGEVINFDETKKNE